ncbi:MAG TPA: rhomboid family intramembrane serine protease [Sedimentisphaerales bacterium]|nr:rhomboid family intramembrane serine protease [Sedimentisphaerales bacterium]
MGLYDRDYTQADFHSNQSHFRYAPQMRMSFPKLTPVVKWLLIINIGVFLAAITIKPLGIFIYQWFELDATSLGRVLQVWRLISYQFLHAPDYYWHIFMNMLFLFFLGPTLERHWGGKKFLPFYLGCGVAGALFYMLLVGVGFLPPIPMVGASGAILGMLAACAILFPHFVVFIFIFPVPIRIAAIGLTGVYFLFVVTKGANAGGHAAHLAGMAAGAAYVFSQSWRDKFKFKLQSGHWEKQMAAQRNLQVELDRILEKVHNSGIQSLNSKEKKILKEATKAEQTRNKF